MPEKFKEKQISNAVLENYKIDLEYNLIDINKFPKQILLGAGSMFSYIMLLEKAKNRTELLENLKNIFPVDQEKKRLEGLASKVNDLLDDVLEEKKKKELLEEIERKVGKKSMSTLFDRLVAEGRMDIQRGKEASKRKIAKNMLDKKIDDEMILEMTEIKKEELEKIKKDLMIAS